MGKLSFRRKKEVPGPLVVQPLLAEDVPSPSKSTQKKKASSVRLWMRMDKTGQSELMECDRSVIVKRASIPARDLRILGPIFSKSSSILARERAMLVNLEFIRAIVTAEEVLLLDPLRLEVLPFVDKLRRQLPRRGPTKQGQTPSPAPGQWFPGKEGTEALPEELPFEFQVLEMALEVVCSYLDSNVAELERGAYPALDELTRNVSTKNLEHIRGLKSVLTRLLARVQKVRDEIEHLLDDNEDMAALYVTRKLIQGEEVALRHRSHRFGSARTRSFSLVSNNVQTQNHHDVEELEMLLEAYLMQLDGTRNKILTVREYIDDTEDYVNIQLDNQRNELIKLQLFLSISSFAVAVESLFAGIFAMNVPCSLYNLNGIFAEVFGIYSAFTLVCYVLLLGYAKWKKLIWS